MSLQTLNEARTAVRSVAIGQDETLDGLIVALLSEGHVLLEGVPGVGKTLMARALAKTLNCRFARVQFTPDLMPADVTGSTILQRDDLMFRPGPVFTNFLLADEINRAPAKTQAALLEAMQERAVTADGVRHPLEGMFMVVATQNPIEQEGTYALPEAELDRFMFMLRVDYPEDREERAIFAKHHAAASGTELDMLQALVETDDLAALRKNASEVSVSDQILDYLTECTRASRVHVSVSVGISPRAGLAWLKAAKTEACLQGRDYVIPDDLKRWAPAIMRHRLVLTPAAEVSGVHPDEVVQSLLEQVAVPT